MDRGEFSNEALTDFSPPANKAAMEAALDIDPKARLAQEEILKVRA